MLIIIDFCVVANTSLHAYQYFFLPEVHVTTDAKGPGITKEEFFKALMDLKEVKAAGFDGIPSKLSEKSKEK